MDKIKANCSNCGDNIASDVLFEKIDNWSCDEGLVYGCSIYRVLQCRGCESFFFQTAKSHSEDIDYYHDPITGEVEIYYPEEIQYYPPVEKTAKPEWLYEVAFMDSDLGRLYDELYMALEAGLHVLAAIGIRTVFDRATEVLGIKPGKTFAEKLDALTAAGHITESNKLLLNDLIEAGSAAAHRGWKPRNAQLLILVEILNNLVYQSLILPEKHKKTMGSIPKRN